MQNGSLQAIGGGLVVSCQAGPESPLNAPHFIAALAQSAERGGCVGFRVDRPENIRAVRAVSRLPIIGINKIPHPDSNVYITPTFASAKAAVDAGADIVALDATDRPRPGGEPVAEIIRRVREELGTPVMADIGSFEDGMRAAEAGADIIATTLAGSPPYGHGESGPALDLARRLVAECGKLVIIEGQVWTVDDVKACFSTGVHAIIVGSSITVPEFITRRFVRVTPRGAAGTGGRA